MVTPSFGITGITGVAGQPAGASRVVVTLVRGGLVVTRDGLAVSFAPASPTSAQVPVLVNGSYVFMGVATGATSVPPRTPCSPWPAGAPLTTSPPNGTNGTAAAPWWTGSNSSVVADTVTLVYPDVTLTYSARFESLAIAWSVGVAMSVAVTRTDDVSTDALMLSVATDISPAFAGRTAGLLGYFNGNVRR